MSFWGRRHGNDVLALNLVGRNTPTARFLTAGEPAPAAAVALMETTPAHQLRNLAVYHARPAVRSIAQVAQHPKLWLLSKNFITAPPASMRASPLNPAPNCLYRRAIDIARGTSLEQVSFTDSRDVSRILA